jgi:protein-export membrane protein SecD
MKTMNVKKKTRITIVFIVLLAVVVGLISYPKAVQKIPFLYNIFNKKKINLGLDLQGGIHLEYTADVSNVDKNKISESLQGAQDVIERRINAFGVGEPLVQSARSGGEYRIIIELPGIKNIEDAKKKIKETPFLEFKEEAGEADLKESNKIFDSMNAQSKKKADEILQKALKGENFEELAKANSQDPGSKDKGGDLEFVKKGTLVPEFDKVLFEGSLKNGEVYSQLVETQFGWHIIKFIESKGDGDNKEVHAEHILFAKRDASQFPEFKYKTTGLSGKNLKSASVVFANQGLSDPEISIKFDAEGTKIFADLTKRNIGKTIAIYLDGEVLSAPRVQAEITTGDAVITGTFTIDEAKELARNLNEGALPVPLILVSQQSIEASLGEASLKQSLNAGMIGLALVVIFMLLYYRYLGLIASLALLIYTGIMISLFKLLGFTLTLSGIAGFILSIGMAVDANILIFERTKEEIRRGRGIQGALDEGFKRAWTSIRDGNVSTIITSLILIQMGTGFVKGFAVTLVVGVLVSMFTAVTISRTLIRFMVGEWVKDKLWMIGVKKKSEEDFK